MICPIMSRNVKGFQVVNFYPVECLKEKCMAWKQFIESVPREYYEKGITDGYCKLIDK